MPEQYRDTARRPSISRRTAISVLGGVTFSMARANAGNAPYFDPNEPLIEDIGAAERIMAADAIRTIFQETAAAACFLFNGIEADASRGALEEAGDDMRMNLNALKYGNLSMNIIGAETRKDTNEVIAQISTIWQDIAPEITAFLNASDDAATLKILQEKMKRAFPVSEGLVAQISGQYSNPAELIQRDALLIDIAGRQSRLTQQIASHTCDIWTNEAESALARIALRASMTTYENSLKGLRDGLPELGLPPAPSDEIAGHLTALLTAWKDTKVSLDIVLENTQFPIVQREALARQTADTMERLEILTQLYVQAAKPRP